MYSVDEKGRISLPAKLRKYVSPKPMKHSSSPGDLSNVSSYIRWMSGTSLSQALRNLSSNDPENRRFIRATLEFAQESQLDTQQRISIPPELRDYADIQNEVRIIGTLDKIRVMESKDLRRL